MSILKSFKMGHFKQFVLVSSIVIAVAVLCFLFAGLELYRSVALVLLVTVSTIAMFFDIYAVLLAALLSALVWDYFFIPPRFTFQISNGEDVLMLLMYFVIASVHAVLTFKLRQIEKVEREKEEKATTIQLYTNLFNSLSHELKTPISTIIGSADNLLNQSENLSDKNKQNLLLEISTASLGLNQQVENLLNMSRLNSGQLKLKLDWCDATELIYSVINPMEEKLKSHHIVVQSKERLPLFKIDFVLMQEVLRNLINNAINYTPRGSSINIKMDYTTELNGHFTSEDAVLDVQKDSEINYFVLEVRDTGPGFPEEEIEKVFDKFYRLKNTKPGGSGLGLSIVKGFVEAHQGHIWLSNLPKGGACFTIEIPSEVSFLNFLKNE